MYKEGDIMKEILLENQLSEEQLINDTLPLVDIIIKTKIQINNNYIGISYDDLYQNGCIALIQAVKKFNPSFNIKFETFASTVIYHKLIDEYRKHKVYTKYCNHYITMAASDSENNMCYTMQTFQEDIEEKALEILEKAISYTKGNVQLGMKIIRYRIIGYSNQEIADKIGIKMTTLYAAISQARKKLKTDPDLINLFENL